MKIKDLFTRLKYKTLLSSALEGQKLFILEAPEGSSLRTIDELRKGMFEVKNYILKKYNVDVMFLVLPSGGKITEHEFSEFNLVPNAQIEHLVKEFSQGFISVHKVISSWTDNTLKALDSYPGKEKETIMKFVKSHLLSLKKGLADELAKLKDLKIDSPTK